MAKASQYIGIDFSGAQTPGDSIWITEGVGTNDEQLQIEDCYVLGDRVSVSGRAALLEELRDLLQGSTGAIIGLDFPFGFPAPATEATDWKSFLDRFHNEFEDEDIDAFPGRFGTNGRTKRDCDYRYAGQSPMSPQVKYQVFFGLRDLLWPLVDAGHVSVCPMQEYTPPTPTLIEVYPAATFGRLQLYRTGYKSGTEARRRQEENAAGLAELSGVRVESESIIEAATVSDDALDSLCAVVATWNAAKTGLNRECTPSVEGYIYA